MLARFSLSHPEQLVHVCRTVQGVPAHRRSAFAYNETLHMTLRISRKLGVCFAALSVKNDKTGKQTEIPISIPQLLYFPNSVSKTRTACSFFRFFYTAATRFYT